MNYKNYILSLIAIALIAACSSNEKKGASASVQASPAAQTTQTTRVQYTCPMHPEVVSDKPGQCPKCGMDLEKKAS
ncbi:MAG: heavy metal-binding domain-containing protein [bacterium]|nr:heavy metal-binding domain-containing protein [bacterium]